MQIYQKVYLFILGIFLLGFLIFYKTHDLMIQMISM